MNRSVHWIEASEALELGAGEVHVWRVNLDRPAFSPEEIWNWLAAEEAERARRFRFPADQNRFAVGRGMLRRILGSYLRQHPRSVLLQYGEFGRPELAGNSGQAQLQFNLSHSDGVALIGIRQSGRIGVDIERVRDGIEFEELATRHFSAAERNELDRATAENKPQEFFRQWTRKEAYLKAQGLGLQVDTTEIDMTRLVGEADPTGDRDQGWSEQVFVPQVGFVASVVMEGRPADVKYWEWKGLE